LPAEVSQHGSADRSAGSELQGQKQDAEETVRGFFRQSTAASATGELLVSQVLINRVEKQ
jgi:hypothetical protein